MATDLKTNFEVFLKKIQRTHQVFYEEIDINEKTFTAQLKSVKGLHWETIARMKSAYPTLNLNWFLTGEGEMLLQGNAGSVQQINNGVVENSHVVGAQNIHYAKSECAECEAKLQEANNKIIELMARIISLLEKKS